MDAAALLIERSRYYLRGEYLPKIRQCVSVLPDGAIWHRDNESSNSIGNLLLHLAGNVRQWIVEGIGGQPSQRDRAAEFAARGGASGEELLAALEAALSDSDRVLSRVTSEETMRECTIQGRDTNVLAAIYHVVEHFAMHTGQIVLMSKMHAPGAIQFYDDSGWVARPLWGGSEGMR